MSTQNKRNFHPCKGNLLHRFYAENQEGEKLNFNSTFRFVAKKKINNEIMEFSSPQGSAIGFI
jgi:hypothetical protein